MTFVQSTFVPVTFVHIRNISAVSGLTVTKMFGPNFLGVIIFVEKMFLDQTCLDPNFFGPKFFFRDLHFWTSNFIGPKKNPNPKYYGPKNIFDPNFFRLNTYFQTKHFFGPKIFFKTNFRTPNMFQNFLVPKFFSQIFSNPIFSLSKIVMEHKKKFGPKIFVRTQKLFQNF